MVRALIAWLLVPCVAHAQGTDALTRGRELLEAGRAEAAVLALEAAVEELEEQSPGLAAEARWDLARAYASLREPDERRFYLTHVSEDPLAAPGLRRRAEEALAELEPPPDEAYDNPFEDPGTIAGVSFMVLEVASLITGGVLFAESNCVDDPMPCDSTMRDWSVGFLVAGSIWWIVPMVLFIGVAALGSAASTQALRDGALIRF